MAGRGGEATKESRPARMQKGLPAGVDPEQRALDVRLRKLSRSTFDKRHRATAAAFDPECKHFAPIDRFLLSRPH